ncbi:hypothetical protein PT974_02869 [Cladobotryum mycophilum]|uniref:Mating type protein n=1 Tax=Cladobotryum mycophilum TaxID=491253 RepID=A0ABR0T0H2_9HYPO
MPSNKQTIGDLVRFLQKFDLNADSSIVLADSDAKLYFQPYKPLFQASKKSTEQGRMRLYGKVQKIQAIEKFEVSEEILLGFQTWLRDPYSFWTAVMTTWQSSPQQSANDNYTAFLIGAFKAGPELEHHTILYRFRSILVYESYERQHGWRITDSATLEFLRRGGVSGECKDSCINLLQSGKRRIQFCKKLRPVKEGENIDYGPLFLLVFHDAIWDKRNVLEGKDLDDEIRRLQDKGINEWSESSGAWSAATAILDTCRRLIWDNSDTTSLMLSQQARHSATKSRQVQKRKAKGSEGPRAHNHVTGGHKRRHVEAPNDSLPIRVESAVPRVDSMIPTNLSPERADLTLRSQHLPPQSHSNAEGPENPYLQDVFGDAPYLSQPENPYLQDVFGDAPYLSQPENPYLQDVFGDAPYPSQPENPYLQDVFGDAPYPSRHENSCLQNGLNDPPYPLHVDSGLVQSQSNLFSNGGSPFQEGSGNRTMNNHCLPNEGRVLAMYVNAYLPNMNTSTPINVGEVAV